MRGQRADKTVSLCLLSARPQLLKWPPARPYVLMAKWMEYPAARACPSKHRSWPSARARWLVRSPSWQLLMPT